MEVEVFLHVSSFQRIMWCHFPPPSRAPTFSHGSPEACSRPRDVMPTSDMSPHVAPRPAPALVALICRGVPGRSFWRHRRCCSLARLCAPACTLIRLCLNCPTAPRAWREVGHWRWSRKSHSKLCSLHFCLHLSSSLLFQLSPSFSVCCSSLFFFSCCFTFNCLVGGEGIGVRGVNGEPGNNLR